MDSRDERSAPRVRLDYLDGLRGLAACYVVISHICVALVYFSTDVVLPRWLVRLLGVFNLGQVAVDVFIVLSGYCLMIPSVRSRGQLKGGFWAYIKRRARRILPPYYIALLGALLLLEGSIAAGLRSDVAHRDLGVLLSHLLVVHNWSVAWYHEIDPPMWSVAVEWQIYFLFPLLLLPVWRRFGAMASVVLGFGLGLAPHFLLGGAGDFACPWFLGLFALGMLGATLNFSDEPRVQLLLNRLPWGALSLFVWVAVGAYLLSHRGFYRDHEWLIDPILGLATTALLVSCTRHLRRELPGPSPPVLRVLGSRLAVGLGRFSYSIYLVHYPLLVLFWQLLLPIPISAVARAAVLFGAGFPIMIGASYLFHRAFEERFMSGHS